MEIWGKYRGWEVGKSRGWGDLLFFSSSQLLFSFNPGNPLILEILVAFFLNFGYNRTRWGK
jgi:hypothetical protein